MSRFASAFYSRFFPWIVVVHTLLFSLFWVTNSLFYASTNDFLADMIGQRLDYVTLLLWISFFIAVWSILRLLMVYLDKQHKLAKLFSWIYGLVGLFYLVFFYGSFQMLFSESPVQLVRLGQLLGYFRFFVDAVVLLGLGVGVAFLVRNSLRKAKPAAAQHSWWLLGGMLIVFGIVWSLPIFQPPAAMLRGTLPEKPRIIAHRGASMLAPENTLAAANLAVQIGVYGLETDVHISRDGKVFLLHDDTFDRTTDVRTVFPGREDERAEDFTLAEINQLNAGKWFEEQDPFHAFRQGKVPPQQAAEYQAQAIPTLAEYLDIARENHLAFRFDLKQPPQGNAYTDSYFDLVLDQVHQAGIDSQIWYIVDQEQLQMLRRVAPEMQATYGADYQSLQDPGTVKAQGYQIVNVEYGISPEWSKRYQEAGLWVDVYTVDEPWQFARLWLLGVDSITTSNAKVMAEMVRPAWMMTFSQYMLLWILVGLVGAGIIVGLTNPVIKARPRVPSTLTAE